MSQALDAATPGTRRQAAARFAVTGLAQVWRLVLSIGSVLVLARLLSPADFGLVAMGGVAMGFAALVQDLGLHQATVQRERLDPDALDALFWTGTLASAVTGLALAASGPLVAAFYGEPRAAAVTAAFGVVILLYGLSGQHGALLARGMRFGVLAAIDVASATAGFVTAVAIAAASGSYWALYWSVFAAAAVNLAGVWIFARWTPRWPRAFGAEYLAMVRFGGALSGSNLLRFVAGNADKIMIGRALGETALGFYDRAHRLLLFPLQQVTTPVAKVMTPLLARLAPEPDRYRRAYLDAMSALLTVAQPGLAMATATALAVTPLLLGDGWAPAAPIFFWLAVAGLTQPFTMGVGWLLISQGRGIAVLWTAVFVTVTTVAAFAIGLRWGAVGVAAAFALSELVRAPIVAWIAGRRGPVSGRDLLGLAALHGAATGAAGLAAIGLAARFDAGTWAGAALAALGAYAAAALVLALSPGWRALVASGLAMLARRERNHGEGADLPRSTEVI